MIAGFCWNGTAPFIHIMYSEKLKNLQMD